MPTSLTDNFTPRFPELLAASGLDHCPPDLDARLAAVKPDEVRAELSRPPVHSPRRLEVLISPAAGELLEDLAQAARDLTWRRFGGTMNLYAPLYVSNFCVNQCQYCGFSARHRLARRRLSVEEALAEARLIAREGFRDLLLVAGEDQTHISVEYLGELTAKLRQDNLFASVSIEIYPLDLEGYRQLHERGVDGMTLYQETYDRGLYARCHPGGPKADFSARLAIPETAAAAGLRRVGLGALLGLGDWRHETLALGRHAAHLMKYHWRTRLSFSFPRLRPAPEVALTDLHPQSDRELVRMIAALRLCFPDAALFLSTRESARFRDRAVHLGITHLSAGSKTSPGGYGAEAEADEQFAVNDDRSPAEVSAMLRRQGFDPVWKDWDAAFAVTA